MCDFAALDEDFRVSQVNERLAEIEKDFGDLGAVQPGGRNTAAQKAPAEVPDDPQAAPTDEAWKKQLTVNRKTGDAEPTIMNALLILQNDPLLKGKIAKNEFLTRVVLRGPVPWRRAVKDTLNGEPWSDADDAGLLLYLENRWNLNAEQKIRYAMTNAAEANAYHPVREYLDKLRWDGVARLDTMLVRWMGAEDTPYTRAVTRKWMTAGVARIYEPGRKFDQMLMLVGPQGRANPSSPWRWPGGCGSATLWAVPREKRPMRACRGSGLLNLPSLPPPRKARWSPSRTSSQSRRIPIGPHTPAIRRPIPGSVSSAAPPTTWNFCATARATGGSGRWKSRALTMGSSGALRTRWTSFGPRRAKCIAGGDTVAVGRGAPVRRPGGAGALLRAGRAGGPCGSVS